MDAPDRTGRVGEPGRGAFMLIQLRLDGGRVAQARYQTYGCGVSIACGSALTELVTGRPVADCLALTPDDVAAALDGLPPGKTQGPALALAALRDALKPEAGDG